MQRWFALVAAVLSTAIVVVVRNTLDLEESRFLLALVGCSTLALALSVGSGAMLHGWTRTSLVLGCAAFVLVPLLYVAYLAFFIETVCVIGGVSCSS